MIEKVVKKYTPGVDDHQQELDNLEYWLSRPPEERIAEVERLRRMVHGEPRPIEKIVRVVDMATGKVLREYGTLTSESET